MKLIVGLGNPGTQYERTRHNAGFMAVDMFAQKHGAGNFRVAHESFLADVLLGGEKILLLKPQTYMNDSGQAVGEAQRYLKISEGDIYVFHDEIDLAPAKLKVKVGGGNAGHNGLRSISAHIGNEYARVRIGVGHPGSKDLVSHYVLHDFAKADADWLEPMLDAMADAAGRLAAGDSARFLTDVARALQADKGSDKNEQKSGDKPAAIAPALRTTAPVAHPAGERQSKRGNALTENLKKWLRGSRGQES